MAAKKWRQRMLSSTRGRVLSLLRWGPRTVNELAQAVGLTDNAVRQHLSALERDGLVEQEGLRPSGGKPAFVYQLSAEAESLFPKGYAAVLTEVLSYVREEQGPEALEAFLRSVGRRAGERVRAAAGFAAGSGDSTADAAELRARVSAAVGLLEDLGGLVAVEESADAYLIRGFSCPLAALVGPNPEACALAEELVASVVDAPVTECCDRTGAPKCAFRVERDSVT